MNCGRNAKKYYTLERDNRELQQLPLSFDVASNYTLERDNRELQPSVPYRMLRANYTLERDNRELQLGNTDGKEDLQLYP